MVLQKTKAAPSGKGFTDFFYRHSHLIFIYAYVIVICKAMVACYRINDFSYLNISILYLSGILLYRLYSLLAGKIPARPAVLLVSSAFLLLLIFKFQYLKSLWEIFIIQNLNSINLAIYYETETYYHQFLPFLILLIPITSAVCYALSGKGAAELSILILSLYMFSFWNNGLDKLISRYVPAYVMLTVLYYCISRYVKTEIRYRNSDTKVTVTFTNILLYSLLLSVLVTLLAAAALHISGSKSIVQIKRNYDLREMRLANSSKKSSFDLTYNIYGGDPGRLGGPINLNTLIALKIKADRPVYLRGTVKDHYDGHSWSKSFDDYAIKGMGSLMETTPEFNLHMTGSHNKKPNTEKMSIQHYGLATSTLFTPNNTESISAKAGKIMYDSSGTFLLMGKDTVSGSYTLKYYYSDTGIENCDGMTGTNRSIAYESSSVDAAEMEYYRNNVQLPYKSYLQVPPSITSRTYALVDAITKDCRTTEEKLGRIINYLSSSYPYSLNVSQVPEASDFVDHFLFTEKKGYCTYFATAATIMCRIAGIPARYVEGFNMDGEMDTAGLYIVRNHKAHAWTEILVSPGSNLWSIADCVPQGASVADISNSSQYRDKFDDDRYKFGDGRFLNMEVTGYIEGIKDYTSVLSVLLYPLFIIPAAMLLLLSVYIIFRLIVFNRMTARLLADESMIPFYRHLTARLSVIEEGISEECCELEYVRNLEDKELSMQLEKVVEACYSEYYGGNADLPVVNKKACNKLIERHMRKKSGFFRYWYCRIRFS
ncbi:MAG TPA: transglutaminaseTgpA domain-containing protein [Clostridia bacterium]|nr:transglutaminaseTgpA domain-containing protein [Clostridia bacterium]